MTNEKKNNLYMHVINTYLHALLIQKRVYIYIFTCAFITKARVYMYIYMRFSDDKTHV